MQHRRSIMPCSHCLPYSLVILFLFSFFFSDCSVHFLFLSVGLGKLSPPPSATESHGQDGWKDERWFLERWCLRVVSVSRGNNGSALLSLAHPISSMQNTAMYHDRSYPSLPSLSVQCPSISHFCTAACIVQERGRKNNGHANYASKYVFICIEMYPVSYSTYVPIVRTVLLAKRAGEWQKGRGTGVARTSSLFLSSVSRSRTHPQR